MVEEKNVREEDVGQSLRLLMCDLLNKENPDPDTKEQLLICLAGRYKILPLIGADNFRCEGGSQHEEVPVGCHIHVQRKLCWDILSLFEMSLDRCWGHQTKLG